MPEEQSYHHLLFVAYFFPPLGGAGVQRSLKFAKYLPDFGWIPHVLTSGTDCNYDKWDETLLSEFRQGSITRVIEFRDVLARFIARFPGIEGAVSRLAGRPVKPKRAIRNKLMKITWLEVPDDQFWWAWRAYRKALDLIGQKKIDAIYTTSSPYSSHLVGYWLKRKTGLPWLADFRDEWNGNPYIVYPTIFHEWINKKLEHSIVSLADRVVTVSEPIIEIIKQGHAHPEKFSVITNGFDEADFSEIRLQAQSASPVGKLFMTYAGSLYDSPDLFFDALANLLTNHDISKEEFRLRMIGKFDRMKLNHQGLDDILEFPGYLDHPNVIKELFQSDVFVLYLPTKRGLGAYSGKIFEYLAARKTILALVPEKSVAARLIQDIQAGVVVSPDNRAGIEDAIRLLFCQWKQGNLSGPVDSTAVARFERRNLTSHLAALLDGMLP